MGGTTGGPTHVREVACGLRALGHTVTVVARPGGASGNPLGCEVRFRATHWPKGLALLVLPRLYAILKSFRPDVIMERYYNFAGAGVLLAHLNGLPCLLEVNAPLVDPPGTLKSRLDTLALGPMRRWAMRQAQWSDAIVTPLASTVRTQIPRAKIHELPWGANVERFSPSIRTEQAEQLARLRESLGLEAERPVAVFLGSFRKWHGAQHFAEAARHVLTSGSDLAFLAIGGGPELERVKAQVAGWSLPRGRFVFTGPQPHERVPQLLALADIGVAPFDLSAHAALQTYGFYWSPLKVFEYMAMAMPVVTIDVPPLNSIVRDGQEGLLYKPGDIKGLAVSIAKLAANANLRSGMGKAARERVVGQYSWQAHCLALDKLLKELVDGN
jgi:starch synthase